MSMFNSLPVEHFDAEYLQFLNDERIDAIIDGKLAGLPTPNSQVPMYYDGMQITTMGLSGFEAHMDSLSSSDSDNGLQAPLEGQSPSETLTREPKTIKDRAERRKEQNRVSQRAFRNRKESYQKNLETTLNQRAVAHHLLAKTYAQQTEEHTRLKAKIKQLEHEIRTLRSDFACDSWESYLHPPESFDLYPHEFNPNEVDLPGGFEHSGWIKSSQTMVDSDTIDPSWVVSAPSHQCDMVGRTGAVLQGPNS